MFSSLSVSLSVRLCVTKLCKKWNIIWELDTHEHFLKSVPQIVIFSEYFYVKPVVYRDIPHLNDYVLYCARRSIFRCKYLAFVKYCTPRFFVVNFKCYLVFVKFLHSANSLTYRNHLSSVFSNLFHSSPLLES